ncbi:hypothetical protein, partial [Mucilaginibacter sp. 5C4]|uniref:hypothetical protein n=1 Tax=Mucilaginibacter sp. 5C4 TaxID=3048589 RepID=UPI002B226A5E
ALGGVALALELAADGAARRPPSGRVAAATPPATRATSSTPATPPITRERMLSEPTNRLIFASRVVGFFGAGVMAAFRVT